MSLGEWVLLQLFGHFYKLLDPFAIMGFQEGQCKRDFEGSLVHGTNLNIFYSCRCKALSVEFQTSRSCQSDPSSAYAGVGYHMLAYGSIC